MAIHSITKSYGMIYPDMETNLVKVPSIIMVYDFGLNVRIKNYIIPPPILD